MTKQTQNTPSDPYQILDESPMFKLSLSSKELFHSNFLEWLSCMDEYNEYKDAFKELILNMAGLDSKSYKWPANWSVKREYNNFDLCIVEEEPVQQRNEPEGMDGQEKIPDNEVKKLYRLLFVIENKVKSIPYQEQLMRYSEEALRINDAYWNKRAQESVKNGSVIASGNQWVFIHDNAIKNRQPKKREVTCIDVDPEHKNSTKKNDYYQDYKKKVKNEKPIFILLTLAEEFPDKPKGNSWKLKEHSWECEWKISFYRAYSSLVKKCFLKDSKPEKDDLKKSIIRNYCDFIENLSTISQNWSKEYNDFSKPFLYFSENNSKRTYFPDYIDAKEHRIHDLYQKLKFSFLCTRLYDNVQDEIKKRTGENWRVFPSNQGGLFKENDRFKPEDNFICVNYTYLHGDPLLEINIHPGVSNGKREFYYAIQVQGDSYERGIQVKATKKNEITANDVWHLLTDEKRHEKLHIINNWMSIPLSTFRQSEWKLTTEDQIRFLSASIVNLSTNTNKQKPPYNKYDMSDGTYIYQKRKIEHNPAIQRIIDFMLSDLGFVLNCLKTGTESQY